MARDIACAFPIAGVRGAPPLKISKKNACPAASFLVSYI
ncbi:hypothetical protein TREAZ_1717 [Leadbettera azotonutricia ZAS-9]|uniref:Uncharacterized protein n=1 Tax=Leadbettera azotonutricia (strain ATCC BAA-888 / DSM 13862 / ZAS-9) TaxID=545695 RepID=F5YCN6_LEAAZ|nr:hypothetical protein TREAZ_1717 [Leadbettera azotonutricia ZAS-9]